MRREYGIGARGLGDFGERFGDALRGQGGAAPAERAAAKSRLKVPFVRDRLGHVTSDSACADRFRSLAVRMPALRIVRADTRGRS
jgi:hypothetical protein